MCNPFCHCYRARGLTFLKDLFFSAHVGEMRVHRAALNVQSSGFIMAEPPRNFFCVCFGRKRRTECAPSEISSPLRARHLHRASAPKILSLLTCWLTRCVCPDGAMRLANSSSDNASGLFQVWCIKLSIKQEDYILFIEVTAYTNADQPAKHDAESDKVYMDFDTAMEIIVVTVNAYGNTGSNTQIMLCVVSLKEGCLIGVDKILVSQKGQPLFSSHTCLCLICEFGVHSAWSLRSDGREHGGRGFRADQIELSAARMTKFGRIGAGEYHMRGPTTPKLLLGILPCPFSVGSLKPAIIVETAVGPFLTISGRCPGENRQGPWHRVF